MITGKALVGAAVAYAYLLMLFVCLDGHLETGRLLFLYLPLGNLLLASVLTCLPLGIKFALKLRRERKHCGWFRQLSNVSTLMLVGLVAVVALWPAGKRIAQLIPRFCEVACYQTIRESADLKRHIAVNAFGWGNPSYFEFTVAIISYTDREKVTQSSTPRRLPQTVVTFPELSAYRGTNPQARFILTEGYLEGYFGEVLSEDKAGLIAEGVWRIIVDYRDGENLPDMVYREQPPFSFVYWVQPSRVYVVASLLALFALVPISFWLNIRVGSRVIPAPRGT